jgi:archaellum component FlaC
MPDTPRRLPWADLFVLTRLEKRVNNLASQVATLSQQIAALTGDSPGKGGLGAKLEKLSQQLTQVLSLTQQELSEMTQLDDNITALQSAVANETAVDQSAITLISGIAQQVQNAVQQALAAGATPDEIQALTDLGTALTTQSSALAQAVTANTPVVPPPASGRRP